MGGPDRRLEGAWWVLRVGLGAGMFAAGLDKFFDALTTWSMYVSPLAERLLPFGVPAFMHAVGVAEMVMGLAILTRWTRAGAYAAAAWLVAVAVNLALARNFWDLVVRDVENALAAFALARLTEWRAARAAAPAEGHPPLEAAHAPRARG